MVKASIVACAAILTFMAAATPVAAQQPDSALAELKKQVDALTREIEAMRLGEDVVAQADSSAYGFGPAASKVYRVRQGASIGGYGEVLYENFAKERENDATVGLPRDQVDALRLILYVGYKFSPKFIFNSEIEFEHATTGQGGEASVEFAYIDYVHSPAFGVRGGMVLVPMGFLNELHEPPIFLGTTRPLTENAIIPTTWRENGAGVFGSLGDFSYRAYIIDGLDAIGGGPSRATGFNAGGLRGGRQKGARALIEDPALVARVDFTPGSLPGVMVGASAYTGNSAQGDTTSAGVDIDATTTILEGHAQYKAHGFDVRALYAKATVDDVARLNARRGLTGAGSIGQELNGWYVQGGYDVLRLTGSQLQLTPYVRYESLNTQAELPASFTASAANDRSVTLIGAELKPITNIVLKADYQIHSNEARTGLNQFNIALGYLF
ncbi:MAG: hypothetical protein ACT4O1_01135 [Gemmatimonadota bacterium]